MDSSDDERQQVESAKLTTKYKKRRTSQIVPPPADLIRRQLFEDNAIVSPIRMRHTALEHITSHDR